jgi:hypothetical protein
MTPNTRKITPNAVNPTPISAETKIQAMKSRETKIKIDQDEFKRRTFCFIHH